MINLMTIRILNYKGKTMIKKIMILALLCSPVICQGMNPSTDQAAQACLDCLITTNKVADEALRVACLCFVLKFACRTCQSKPKKPTYRPESKTIKR